MKKLLVCLWLLFASVASATTLVPVQLLNPAASASGQTIVSTGSSSAPAWGGVGVNGIAAIAANTVLANATSSSASPTAFVMPSCSTSTSALNWTTSTGFTCSTVASSGANSNITSLSGLTTALSVAQGGTGRTTLTTHGVLVGEGTSAINQLAVGTTGQVLVGSTSADPAFGSSVGALTFTGAITPLTTAGIVGTTAADNANAGSVGEYPNNSTTGTSISTAGTINATSTTLSAGDWDVQCDVEFVPAGSTVPTSVEAAVSTTSATAGGLGTLSYMATQFTAGQPIYISSPVTRINVSSSTTAYCIAYATFTTSTMTVSGFIRARRPR